MTDDTREGGVEREECHNPLCEEELSADVDEDTEGYCSWECAVMARDGTADRILRERDDGLRADGGSPQGSMNIQRHDGDPVREAINRSEFVDVMASGEVDGHDVLVHAYVNSVDSPSLDVYAGGRWDSELQEYVDGRVVTERFDRLWHLDRAFGELLREHDLDYVEEDRDE